MGEEIVQVTEKARGLLQLTLTDLHHGPEPLSVLVQHRILGGHLDQLGLLIDH
ncbi:hypothetical protein ACQP0C_20920 [Nocardia sp. CA-129566]|uniref:hypothetical protein n=1 Tax=Nocardia sp. CA-129566 TaxID=3239976 RepID=UPI003D95EA5E